MPRLFWLCDATQAPSKNLKEKSREEQPQDEDLKIITYATTINTIPSAEELSKIDEPPSWLTRLRKAADLQRKSRHPFYIDPPVINSHQSNTPLSGSPVNTATVDLKPDIFELESPTYEDSKATISKAKSKPRPSTTEPLSDPSLAEEYKKAILAYISSGTVPRAKSKSKSKTKSSSKSSSSPQAQTSKSTPNPRKKQNKNPPKEKRNSTWPTPA
ncbi:hypothetical protein HYALB_00012070 [Hymenoscyphus albidus]|uniref:Uncharacterized protein n=1 Tax=Hymenoscyphus albidus TaxID=595503 RepID=A0A9N9PVN6_9HELO|nr:hypothetical protein HYALB_00012070 [Hymenoscyphus albidus]